VTREIRTKLSFEPRTWQRRFFVNAKRFNVLVVHRRGGKTVSAIMWLIDGACRCELALGRFGYIAPELKQAREIAWDYLKFYTKDIPHSVANETNLTVTFGNGAKISLYGADKPDRIRGSYFDRVVLDEVAQMKTTLWGQVIRPMLADREGEALFIGTPKGINLFSERYNFARAHPDTWYSELLTYHDSGALSESEVAAMREDMTDNEFAQEMLCDFSASTSNALISMAEVEESFDRGLADHDFNWSPRVMGVDTAWMGNDRSAIARRQGQALLALRSYRQLGPMELVTTVCGQAATWQPDCIFVDAGFLPGIYQGVTNLGYKALPVMFGDPPDEPRFANKRAEMWFGIRDWVRGGGAMPRSTELAQDLCAPTYKVNANGKILLESKEDMRSRGLPSPDLGDALAVTFAYPVAARDPRTGRPRDTRQAKTVYPPS